MVHDLTEGFLYDLSSCSQTRITVKGNQKCQLADDLSAGGNAVIGQSCLAFCPLDTIRTQAVSREVPGSQSQRKPSRGLEGESRPRLELFYQPGVSKAL